MATAATSLSSQSMLMAQAGAGEIEREGSFRGPDTACFSLLLIPFTSQRPAGLGQSRVQEQLEEGGWDRAPREGALGPRRGAT